VRPPSWRAWPRVLAAGAVETIGFVWISLGIARAPVAVVSPFAGLSSAFTVLYAWLVVGERPVRPVLVGAALVCVGVVLLSL
jgi:drug/metabolite transporter (DMT)-like permease